MKHIDDKKTIAVVGAGIVGICCALYLQRAGYKVTLLDKEKPAQGASKGNAGHFAVEQIFPLADINLLPKLPNMLIDPLGPFKISLRYLLKAIPWFIQFALNMEKSKFENHKEAIKALNREALSAYDPILKDANAEHLVKVTGSLLVSETANCNEFKNAYMNFKSNGIDVELIDKKQLATIEPNLTNNIQAAMLFKDAGHTLDPEQLCLTLFQQFLNRGGEFKQTPIHKVMHYADKVTLSSKQTTYHFNQVVIACGAWSKPLVTQLGYKVPLDTERGYHLMHPRGDILSIPVASFERKFIMTPMQSGLRVAGTVEFAGLKAPKNSTRARSLLPHAEQLLPSLTKHQADLLPDWMGFRPSLPDSLPVIGMAPNHKNVFFAFGHHHLGMTQGAITGKLIAELVSNGSTSLSVKPYCISRFN